MPCLGSIQPRPAPLRENTTGGNSSGRSLLPAHQKKYQVPSIMLPVSVLPCACFRGVGSAKFSRCLVYQGSSPMLLVRQGSPLGVPLLLERIGGLRLGHQSRPEPGSLGSLGSCITGSGSRSGRIYKGLAWGGRCSCFLLLLQGSLRGLEAAPGLVLLWGHPRQ